MIKQLSHICLSTPDIPQAVAFYQSVLGCTIAHEFKNAEGFVYGVFLHAGNSTFIELFNIDEPPQQGGLYRHLCFEVDDLAAHAADLIAKGFKTEIVRSRSDKTLQCWIADPDGNKIEFHQYDAPSRLQSCLHLTHTENLL